MIEKRNTGSRIFRGTVIIVLVAIVAKFASFIVEAILASYLGTTYRSDAYYMVSSIQQVVYPMLSVGIWKVFLPVYKDKMAKDNLDGADSIANKIITFFTLFSFIIAILLFVFSDTVVSIVAPGFQGETKSLCVQLVRISTPMYVFIIAAAVYASMLQCHEKFLGSQIREVASHIPIILVAIFFYTTFGVQALAVALVLGSILRLIIEFPFVDWGYKFKVDFKFKCEEFTFILKRLPSALISEGVTQLNTLIDKIMASTLPEGTVSGLNYGNKLMNVFSGLLSSAIATAMYPKMIELIALNRKNELNDLLIKILNIFSLLMIPVTVACIFFRKELVTVVYSRGSFGLESVQLTAGIFAFYCLGLFFVACNTVINNVFYSYGDTKTPMYVNVVNLVCNVTLNLVLIHFIGINGLPLATSLSSILSFSVSLFFIKKSYVFNFHSMLVVNIKVIVASLLACFIPKKIISVFDINVYLDLIIAAIIGMIIYFVLISVLRIDEIDDLVGRVKEKVKNIL